MTQSLLLVGVVRKPHGVTGEVAVEPVTDFPERFVEGLTLVWRGESSERDLTVSSVRVHGARLLVRFDGIGDAGAARELSGGELSVAEEEAILEPEDYYYSHRIAGWRCEDARGREIGRVTRLEQTAGGALLQVDTGGREPVSVPFTRPIVVEVDPKGRRIVLDPPEGLLDL